MTYRWRPLETVANRWDVDQTWTKPGVEAGTRSHLVVDRRRSIIVARRNAFVDNGQVARGSFTDILTNPAGDRIRAHGVFVVDISTETVRFDRFELTCLGPA